MNTNVSFDSASDIPLTDILPTRAHRLRQRCFTARIRASRFSNSKADGSMKTKIHDDTSADFDMYTFSKKLLTKEVMTKVQKHYSRARDLMRIPADGKYDPMRFGISQWNTGEVLIVVGRLQDLQAAFAECQGGLKGELKELEPEWNQLLRNAEVAAGDLFDADLMPTFDDFANAWKMDLEISALPEFDPRITLDDAQLKDVITQVYKTTKDRLTEKLAAGWREAARSMMQSLEYTAAVLGNDPDTVQRLNGTKGGRKSKRAVPIADTLFENLTNQIKTTRALAESAEDYKLMELADQAATGLGNLQADFLRRNPEARKKAAGNAKRLVAEAKEVVNNTEKEVQSTMDELEAFA